MKKPESLIVLALLAASLHEAKAVIMETYNFTGVNKTITDNNPFGVTDERTISGSAIDEIGQVNVFLNISGGFNGDLYVTLNHSSGYSVLLNRVSRRSPRRR